MCQLHVLNISHFHCVSNRNMRIKVCLISWFKWSRARLNAPSEVNASFVSKGLSIHIDIFSSSFCIKIRCQEDEGSGEQFSPKPYQALLSNISVI